MLGNVYLKAPFIVVCKNNLKKTNKALDSIGCDKVYLW